MSSSSTWDFAGDPEGRFPAIARLEVAEVPFARPTVVPYVTTWSKEQPALFSQLKIRADGFGLAWENERPTERDTHGVLWARVDGERRGVPCFGAADPLRQRKVMEQMLCQVCAGPSSRTSKGYLFLNPAPDEAPGASWGEEDLTSEGPVCLPCAGLAVEQCRALRRQGAVALRARKVARFGVYGTLFQPDRSGRLVQVTDDIHFAYSDPASAWLVAVKLLVELRRCTVVDLTAELSQSGASGSARAPRTTRLTTP